MQQVLKNPVISAMFFDNLSTAEIEKIAKYAADRAQHTYFDADINNAAMAM